jgi:hypothetical protein
MAKREIATEGKVEARGGLSARMGKEKVMEGKIGYCRC